MRVPTTYMYKHKTKTKRKVITIQELAKYLGVHRNTLSKRIQSVDLRDILSVLDYVRLIDKD